MVKLVYTGDLKSPDCNGHKGSTPFTRTKYNRFTGNMLELVDMAD